MALPIVGIFWHKMANDREFIKMYQSRFPEPKPEVLALFGCPNYAPISPDTLRMLIEMDSTLRDSLRSGNYEFIREAARQQFGQEGDEGDNGEPGEKRNIFDRIFGRRQGDKQEPDGKPQQRQ